MSDILAVPDGAKMKLSVNDVDKILIDGVDVFPVQPDPVDQATEPRPDFLKPPFADLPFQLNDKAYAKDSVVRQSPQTSTHSARCATSTSVPCRSPPRSTTPTRRSSCS